MSNQLPIFLLRDETVVRQTVCVPSYHLSFIAAIDFSVAVYFGTDKCDISGWSCFSCKPVINVLAVGLDSMLP